MASKPKPTPLWQLMRYPGRPRVFETPEELWEACLGYFQWIDQNPLYEAKLVGPRGIMKKVPKMRATTRESLCIFLGISTTTWEQYKDPERFPDRRFATIVQQIGQMMRDQKFTGASADLLNSAFIARDLGMRDARELTGPGGKDLFSAFAQAVEELDDDEEAIDRPPSEEEDV